MDIKLTIWLDRQEGIENARVGLTSLLSFKHALQLTSICKFWDLDS
jgi:hypothetical protein